MAKKRRTTSWGGVAEWYDRLLKASGDTYQAAVILPHVLRLLRISEGERVLDLACGQGFFSAAFAKAGADVIGADISPELVALAGRNAGAALDAGRASFMVAPSNDLAPLGDGSMDKAVIILAIQNIADVRGTFAECRRVLARGGRLLVVMNHPAFRVPKGSGWGWDDGRRYRRVDRYLGESKTRIAMHPGDDPEAATVSFHRPLQAYVKALARSGFAVVDLEEWTSHKRSAPGPRAKEEDRSRKEIPLFLCIVASAV